MHSPTDPTPDDSFADQIDAALEKLWRGSSAGLAEVLNLSDNDVNLAAMLRDAATGSTGVVSQAIPQRIGRYEIVREIGRGGMGVVYEARQAHPSREVAIKVVLGGHFADPIKAKLFRREVAALARLKHPSIAAIHEADRSDGSHEYFVMELVRGVDVLTYAQSPSKNHGAPLPLHDRVRLFHTICVAISYAHQRGVIHRDLKPSNILVEDDGTPKILDFGLARLTDDDSGASTLVTMAGRVVGTLPYMSPEQARGAAHEVDVRSDVYSLGLLLYELVTGQLPYPVRSAPQQAVKMICESPPTRPGLLNPAVKGDLETIILKALEKEPSRRYQAAEALADDIDRYLRGDMITARPATAIYQLRKFAKRNKGLVAGTLLVAVTLVLGIAGTTMQAIRARRAELKAHEQTRVAESALADSERESKRLRQANEFYLTRILESAFPWRMGRSVKVIDAIDRSTPDLASEFEGNPETEALIRHYVGNIYQMHGRLSDAESHLRRSVDLWNDVSGSDSWDALSARTWLGRLYRRMGRWDDAETEARRVLALSQTGKEQRPWRLPEARAELAITLREMGRFEEAEDYFRACIDLMIERYGFTHSGVFHWRWEYALLLIESNRLADAIQMYQHVLDETVRRHGPDSREVVRCHDALRHLYTETNNPPMAEAMARTVHRLRQARYGDHRSRTIQAALQLAKHLRDFGSPETLDEAIQLFDDAVARYRQRNGDEHAATIGASIEHAIALMKADRLPEAEDVCRAAMNSERRLSEAGRYGMPWATYAMVNILRKQGKFIEADVLALDDIQNKTAYFGPGEGLTLEAVRNYGLTLHHSGQPRAAQTYYEKYLRDIEREEGEVSAAFQAALENFAFFQHEIGNHDQSEALYRRALVICVQRLGDPGTATNRLRRRLTNILKRAGRPERARGVMVEGREASQKRFGPNHPWTVAYEQAIAAIDQPAN